MFSLLTKTYSFTIKYSVTLITILFGTTCWLFGNGNINILRLWYCIIMPLLFLLRIPDYIKRKYYHFFYELCYYINILSIIILLLNYDLKIIYPFLHGPLMSYSLLKDKFSIINLNHATSFALHSFGTIITHKIYWNSQNILNISDLTTKTYFTYLKTCSLIYLTWLIPYCIYIFNYKGITLTSIKYYAKLKENEKPSFINKIYYLSFHIFLFFLSISFGIILMHSYELDTLFCILQMVVSLINGNKNYNIKNDQDD